jgi:cysteine-rich CPCC protein
MSDPSFPCPCCGYFMFEEPPNSYDICEICFWEDDALQLEFATTLDGGANTTTLAEAQQAFADIGASAARLAAHVRKPNANDRRDPQWRPIDPTDRFPDWNDPHAKRARAADEALYYWRPTYWLLRPDG